jgi:hypothetical protein
MGATLCTVDDESIDEPEDAATQMGIKLANALIAFAWKEAKQAPPEMPLSGRDIILAAADHLAEETEVWRKSPLDPSVTSTRQRRN